MLNVNNNDVDIGKEMTVSKNIDRDRTRTCNPQLRKLMPYPLGHTTLRVRVDSRLSVSIQELRSELQQCCIRPADRKPLH